MPRDYDTQLIESVAVRRRRVREALLFGTRRTRRTFDENVTKLFAGIAVAAVLCAGCVGWSFLQEQLRKQRAEQERINNPPTVTATATSTPRRIVSPTGYGTYETVRPSKTKKPKRSGSPERTGKATRSASRGDG